MASFTIAFILLQKRDLGKTRGPCPSQHHSLLRAQQVTTHGRVISGLSNFCDNLRNRAQLVGLSKPLLPPMRGPRLCMYLLASTEQLHLLGTYDMPVLSSYLLRTTYFVNSKTNFWRFRKLPKLHS